MAGVALVADRRLGEADPHGHPPEEAAPLAHGQQRVERPAVEQAEVTRVRFQIDLGELVEDPVEPFGRGQLEARLALPLLTHRVDHVGPLRPEPDHVSDQLRRILEVCVEHGHRLAPGVLEPGGQRGLVAEVAREVDDAQARVGVGQAVEDRRRGVVAPVVDDDQLVVETGQGGGRPVVEGLDDVLLVEDRSADAQELQ